MKPIFLLTLLSACLLTACQNNNSEPKQATALVEPTPVLKSVVKSSLTIQQDQEPPEAVASYSTDGDENMAYHLESSLLVTGAAIIADTVIQGLNNEFNRYVQPSKSVFFQLPTKDGKLDLHVQINALTSQLIAVKSVLHNKSSTPNAPAALPQFFQCETGTGVLFSGGPVACKNIQVSVNDLTGKTVINFNQLQLSTATGIVKVGLDSTVIEPKTLTLSGVLEGEISLAPQRLKDLPKSFTSRLMVDGQEQPVFAVAQTVDPSTGQRDAVQVMLETGDLIQTDKSLFLGLSNYIPFRLSGSPFDPTFSVNNSDHISLKETTSNIDLTFNSAVYENRIVKGRVQFPKFSYLLTFSNSKGTLEKTNHTQSVTLINHNQKILHSENMVVTLKNNQIQRVELFPSVDVRKKFLSNQVFFPRFSCEKTACAGVTVSANGYAVQFKNTVLKANTSDLAPVVAEDIQVTGEMVYHGR